MDSIIYRQKSAAAELTGKRFALAIAGLLLRLAIAQAAISLLAAASGLAILNAAVYLYAIWLFLRFVDRTASCYVYTLRAGSMILERRLGDSTITVVEIPIERITAMRPVRRGERLHTTYRRVKVIGPACRPALRVRAAFALSLISAHLARVCAGRGLEETLGHVLVFGEDGERSACVFAPDERMCAALAQLLSGAYGFDERMTHARVTTMYGRALERAFPALYPYVDPLVNQSEVQWARGEVKRQKAERKAKRNAKNRNPRATEETKNEANDAGEKCKDVKTRAPRRRRKQG